MPLDEKHSQYRTQSPPKNTHSKNSVQKPPVLKELDFFLLFSTVAAD